MPFAALADLVFLHAGTPIEVSQATLSAMLVVFAILVMGFGFGRISKSQESLKQHRWMLTSAVVLSLVAIFAVMIPAAFRFYIDPDPQFFEALSLNTLVHASLGTVAVVSAVVYVFGDLPVNVKRWMRVTAVLWVAALGLGVLLFLQMLSLL
jgi:hypothetical protein